MKSLSFLFSLSAVYTIHIYAHQSYAGDDACVIESNQLCKMSKSVLNCCYALESLRKFSESFSWTENFPILALYSLWLYIFLLSMRIILVKLLCKLLNKQTMETFYHTKPNAHTFRTYDITYLHKNIYVHACMCECAVWMLCLCYKYVWSNWKVCENGEIRYIVFCGITSCTLTSC